MWIGIFTSCFYKIRNILNIEINVCFHLVPHPSAVIGIRNWLRSLESNQGLNSQTIFHQNSKSMKSCFVIFQIIIQWSLNNSAHAIVAVLVCVRFGGNLITRICKLELIFHQIWMVIWVFGWKVAFRIKHHMVLMMTMSLNLKSWILTYFTNKCVIEYCSW